MTRRSWIPLACALARCRRQTPLDLLPETMAGRWRRVTHSNPSAWEAPDPVPVTAIRRSERAAYEGPGKIDARIYELTAPGVALDLVQRWRPSADTVFFYQGNYFVVVKWEEADRTALREFVGELEKRMRVE